jgi:hypothetical protein
MSINNILDMTAITPAGYAELIKTHLPPLSFTPSCDPSDSHQIFIHGDAPDPNHNVSSFLIMIGEMKHLLDISLFYYKVPACGLFSMIKTPPCLLIVTI